jgi:hypothetical protein
MDGSDATNEWETVTGSGPVKGNQKVPVVTPPAVFQKSRLGTTEEIIDIGDYEITSACLDEVCQAIRSNRSKLEIRSHYGLFHAQTE